MRICVTGGSGFIGWYFCHRLAEAGHSITILDLIEPGDDLPEHTFVRGDVRDHAAVRKACEGCEAVVNLAAAHHDFGIEEQTYYDVNEGGATVICEVMDELGIRQLIFYSTVAVYGEAEAPIDENTPPAPNSPYGGSKLKGEQVFDAWTKQGDGRHALIIRPTVTFGPRNFANMYSLIRQIHSGKYAQVGSGTNIKSLSYVENIVDATLFLWGKRESLDAFAVFNYIDKPDLCSRDIAGAIFDALKRKPPKWSIPMWFARLLALPFDIVIAVTGKNIPISGARIKKLFVAQTKFEADRLREAGYTPAIPLRDAIAKMVDWYVERGKDESAEWHQPPADVVRMTADG